MKILAVDRSAKFYGSAIDYMRIASHFKRIGQSCELILAEDGPFVNECTNRELSVSIFKLPNRLNKYGRNIFNITKLPLNIVALFIYNLKFTKFLWNNKINSCDDLIYVNNYRTFVYYFLAILLTRIKGHKIILKLQTSDMPLFFFKVLSLLLPCKVLISGTEMYAKNNLGYLYTLFSKKIECLPSSVDTNKFKPCTTNMKLALRARHGFPVQHYTFISVGSIEPRKGTIDLLKAFSSIGSDDVCLLHVGGHSEEYIDYYNEVCNISRMDPRIKMLGKRNDVDELLNASDCFILNSEFEGMPNSIVEAMSCGLPVICTNIASNPEVVTSNIGVLIEYGDRDALIGAMYNFYSHDVKVNFDRNVIRATVKSNYSLSSWLTRKTNIFLNV